MSNELDWSIKNEWKHDMYTLWCHPDSFYWSCNAVHFPLVTVIRTPFKFHLCSFSINLQSKLKTEVGAETRIARVPLPAFLQLDSCSLDLILKCCLTVVFVLLNGLDSPPRHHSASFITGSATFASDFILRVFLRSIYFAFTSRRFANGYCSRRLPWLSPILQCQLHLGDRNDMDARSHEEQVFLPDWVGRVESAKMSCGCDQAGRGFGLVLYLHRHGTGATLFALLG
jgi:hypothetical protein